MSTEVSTTVTFDQIKALTKKVILKLRGLISRYLEMLEPQSQAPLDGMYKILDALEQIASDDSSESYTVPTYNDSRIKCGYFKEGKFYYDEACLNPMTGETGFFYMDMTGATSDEDWVAYKFNVDTNKYTTIHLICWVNIDVVLATYDSTVVGLFSNTNVNGGVEIQLMPFVQYSLMNSSRFKNFVSSFTQVHKALEPVIMERLDGNNYLDCKLIATYGQPHTYCADINVDKKGEEYFWPDLNIQIEFDVKLFNQALATNTLNELRLIVKSYFNRLTSIHTPVDLISMNNNIYISHLIQQMEAHDNVAYMKFKGWYTQDKPNGNYMDANIQAIVQKWRRLDDFPKYTNDTGRLVSELEHFVPEMFVMEDDNIVINILK
jgi:hypothetical protein